MPAHHATPEARDARVIVTSPVPLPDGTRKVAVLIDGAEAAILSPRCERPEACVARGNGHCRACAARANGKASAAARATEARSRASALAAAAGSEGIVRVPLSRGYAAIINGADAADVLAHSWYAHLSPSGPYARANLGHRHVYMHRFILGAVAGQHVDHINHNRLDNRRSNLRLCTATQNAHHQRKYRGASPYKGVHIARGRWQATITVDGINHYLGTYDDQVEAALAYDNAARRLQGRFAVLNFPAASSPIRVVPCADGWALAEGSGA